MVANKLAGKARVSLALEAREVADLARGMVGDTGAWLTTGERVRKAQLVARRAQTVLDRAVLVELASGASWVELGEALGMDWVEAQRIYEPTWIAWQAASNGYGPAFEGDGIGLPGDEDLARVAESLDLWWGRHAEPWEAAGDDATPVTRALASS